MSGGPSVVFDMDGVLSDASNRQHHLQGPIADWEAFFSACGDDELIEEAAGLTHLLDPGLVIVLLTARPIRVRPQTMDWLSRQSLRWDLLIMRGEDDWSSSHTFKRLELGELQRAGFDVRLALDDDPRNVEMYRRSGVPAIYFHSGYYE